MGFEAEFADLMKDIVTIRPFAGTDAYGQPAFGDPVQYRCRVLGRVRRLTSFSGEEKVSTAQMILLNSTGIDPRSQITLPDGFLPQSPPILAVLRDRDDSGALTETIYT